ncbi:MULTISPECIES: hypothetical protein [Actinomadura]|uniref:Uncharacterized protein n=1 Tax=Actinomadura yumaensis TaxID=111807 RepID=A0ABW2CBW9_9ACTN|nr:hypothetical protein [Actinomadura sp. J1-007]MWK33606.1 hypothetical protein [Actinomadura sp. J1-007]
MAYRRYAPRIGIVGLIYVIIGIFVAWDRGYITTSLIRWVVSALLAILLWFLVLLGVDLHIRA